MLHFSIEAYLLVARGKKNAAEKQSNSAGLGFEEKLWAAADKLRGHMDAGEYKHVVLGLIFLKYISDAFQECYEKVAAETYADLEDRDEYSRTLLRVCKKMSSS